MTDNGGGKMALTTDQQVREWSLKEAKRIAIDVVANRCDLPVQLYLYGSSARGDITRTSDIDIAILSGKPIPAMVLTELRTRLEESHIPYDVDVVDLNEVDDGFRQRVVREGICWYG